MFFHHIYSSPFISHPNYFYKLLFKHSSCVSFREIHPHTSTTKANQIWNLFYSGQTLNHTHTHKYFVSFFFPQYTTYDIIFHKLQNILYFLFSFCFLLFYFSGFLQSLSHQHFSLNYTRNTTSKWDSVFPCHLLWDRITKLMIMTEKLMFHDFSSYRHRHWNKKHIPQSPGKGNLFIYLYRNVDIYF